MKNIQSESKCDSVIKKMSLLNELEKLFIVERVELLLEKKGTPISESELLDE